MPDLIRERAQGWPDRAVAGVDEVGRGPLAGPVVAAAVILPAALPDDLAVRLDDSKRLTAAARAHLAPRLEAVAIFALGAADPAEIDRLNILNAAHLAMARAVAGLATPPAALLVDGNRVPSDLPCPAVAVVGGDRLSLSIAAASILAKQHRDGLMAELARRHPGYGWERNAGYPTAEHRAAIAHLGLTPQHRRSFAPCRAAAVPDSREGPKSHEGLTPAAD